MYESGTTSRRMAHDDPSRRQVLQGIGSVSTAVTGAIAGCLDIGNGSPGTDSGPDASSEWSDATDTGSEATMTHTDLPTPASLSDRQYATFSGQPSEYLNWYTMTSIQPTVLISNRWQFGKAYRAFIARWARTFGGAPFTNQTVTVWAGDIAAILGEFDPAEVREGMDLYPMEKHSTYREFTLYEGSMTGSSVEILAVNEDVLFLDPVRYEGSAERIEHLIDLARDDATPHYESSSMFSEVVERLPQGAYTRVYPRLDRKDREILKYGVVGAGETLLFDAERSPATGLTVLQYEEATTDPRQQTERLLTERDSAMKFAISGPDIQTVDDRTVVVADTVDPEATFCSPGICEGE